MIGYLSETCCAFRKFYLKFGDGLLRRAPEEKGPWNGFFVFELRGEEPGMFRWPCRWDTSELRRVPSPSAPCGGSHCDPGCRVLARLIVWLLCAHFRCEASYSRSFAFGRKVGRFNGRLEP